MSFWQSLFLYDEKSPMIFTNGIFWLFFFFILLVYQGIYHKQGWRNNFLLVFSLFFYYKSGGWFFFLLLFSTVVDFVIGNIIYRSKHQPTRTALIVASLVINLGLLAYYKYTYFFTELLNQGFKTQFAPIDYMAYAFNQLVGTRLPYEQIILPVGISFYTFQTLSYSIDIYRGHLQPARNIWDFAFFVSFFPQLVAGPIVRASDFIGQIYEDYRLTREEYSKAIFLIVSGLIKKILISDYISTNFVDRVFENPTAFSGLENLLAVYGYAIQIYCDFSGYTDIAIGLSLLLGFRLNINFDSPYVSASITEFWRRWHISLSSWLRDYLYIPLGGNRNTSIFTYMSLPIMLTIAWLSDGYTPIAGGILGGVLLLWVIFLWSKQAAWAYIALVGILAGNVWLASEAQWFLFGGLTVMMFFWVILLMRPDLKAQVSTYANLSITMLLGGLWHGASLRFIIWGALHGGALAVHKFYLDITGSKNIPPTGLRRFVGQFITFHFVCFCWIYFRAKDVTTVNAMLAQMAFSFNPQLLGQVVSGYSEVMLIMLAGYLVHWTPRRVKDDVGNGFGSLPELAKAFVIAAIVVGLYQARSAEIQPFIYFQF